MLVFIVNLYKTITTKFKKTYELCYFKLLPTLLALGLPPKYIHIALYTLDNKFIGINFYYPNNFTGIVISRDGTKEWFQNGNRHREDGPAIECAYGAKSYFINNKLHRLDGPSVEYPDGTKRWHINGISVDSEEQHKCLVDLMKLKGLL